MATWRDVERFMAKLGIETSQTSHRAWTVGGKALAWERPLRQSDLKLLGDSAPRGAILAVHVPMLAKEMLLASGAPGFFTIPHFKGYPAILVHLPQTKVAELRAIFTQALAEFVVNPSPRRTKRKGSS